MNIALMAHDNKKELMIQFCIAYCGILSKHNICATGTTGRVVAEASGMNIKCFMNKAHGGVQQIGARIAYDEIDMVLYLAYPKDEEDDANVSYIRRLCDEHSVPIATNIATAEMLIQGLARGDLDWREIAFPRSGRSPL
jgi:methylglyoxal synthase